MANKLILQRKKEILNELEKLSKKRKRPENSVEYYSQKLRENIMQLAQINREPIARAVTELMKVKKIKIVKKIC